MVHMEEKLTDEQLYQMKNEYLYTYFEEVSPKDFYRDVFPEGSFERAGHPAVSYTPLDVYKRQVIQRMGKQTGFLRSLNMRKRKTI